MIVNEDPHRGKACAGRGRGESAMRVLVNSPYSTKYCSFDVCGRDVSDHKVLRQGRWWLNFMERANFGRDTKREVCGKAE